MTTGVPLYLVSACGSAEEFVAAFRRYADRAGLFVPVAEPLPAGRRGRIAIALKDGGVMIEGEAEVVASSARPSGMYGRVGMTLKFVEPDEPSKIVIAELEKARLAMKPAPPSVPPRPAVLPAEPRAVPPAPGGRIDAANALAESVIVGDAAQFRDGAPPVATGEESTKLGPGKFVIPSIPPSGRPKVPTTPPALTKPRTPTAQVPVIKPIVSTPPVGVVARQETESGVVAAIKPESSAPKPTTLGVHPIERAPAIDPIPPKATRIGFPAIKLPAMDAPAVIVAARPTEPDPPPQQPSSTPFQSRMTPPQPIKVVVPPRPAGPPMPRQPTPFTPLPIVRRPPSEAPLADDPEKTDLTDVPQAPVGEEQRKTSLGVAIVTATVAHEGSEPTETRPIVDDDSAVPDEPAPAARSGGMRASEIMAAIQGEDWTMTPDAPQPTMLPAVTVETVDSVRPTVPMDALDKSVPDAASEPTGPAGDWTMSVEPSAADGWTPPATIEKPPAPPATGNRVLAVASTKPFNAVEWEDKPTGIGEPLVEIDPTLMPAIVEGEPAHVVSPAPFGRPRANTPPPIPIPRAARIPPPLLPGSFSTTGSLPRLPGASQPMPVFAEPIRPDAMDSTSLLSIGKRKRLIAIAIGVACAAGVLAVVIMLVLALRTTTRPTATRVALGSSAALGSSTLGSAGSGAVAMVVGSDSHVVEPPIVIVDAGAPPVATCKLEIASVPDAVEIWLDDNQLGVTPTTLDLPCHAEAKLVFKKAKVGTAIRTITPDANTTKLVVRFAAAMISLKVLSTPPGATIMVGGKVLGITPTTVHVPATGAALILTKDGYSTETERVPAKSTATVRVTLKRAVKTQKLR